MVEGNTKLRFMNGKRVKEILYYFLRSALCRLLQTGASLLWVRFQEFRISAFGIAGHLD